MVGPLLLFKVRFYSTKPSCNEIIKKSPKSSG